jgi:flagellum-specific peptidoglycan hydrolase FlgJ
MLSKQQELNLDEAAIVSVKTERATTCPAILSLAQWAIESQWGLHSPGFNSFGIKRYSNCFGVQSLKTTEFVKGKEVSMYQDFATFPNLYSCFVKHAELLTEGRPYKDAFLQYSKDKSVENFAKGIAQHYSTNPNYPSMLHEFMADPRIVSAIQGVKL